MISSGRILLVILDVQKHVAPKRAMQDFLEQKPMA
jgi:hypothetical protein